MEEFITGKRKGSIGLGCSMMKQSKWRILWVVSLLMVTEDMSQWSGIIEPCIICPYTLKTLQVCVSYLYLPQPGMGQGSETILIHFIPHPLCILPGLMPPKPLQAIVLHFFV